MRVRRPVCSLAPSPSLKPRRTDWTVRRPRISHYAQFSRPRLPEPHPLLAHPAAARGGLPTPTHPHTFLPSALAICFKALRDLNGSDPHRLKHIINKIKDMAHGAPDLVLETTYHYFTDNPEVGAARAPQGRRGEQSGGLTSSFSMQQLQDLGHVKLLIRPLSCGGVGGGQSGPTCTDHPQNSLVIQIL